MDLKRLSLVLLLVAATLTVYNLWPSPAIQLEGVEVREYQGQRLDSIVTGLQSTSIKGTQQIDIASYHLLIGGLTQKSLSLTYGEVLTAYTHYQKVVTLNCVEGWQATILWEGVLLKDLVAAAGASPDAKVVIFYAADGYTSSLAIDYLINNDILLAYKVNEVKLPPERGFPFQVVAEDKWGYKWVKWVTRIELSSDVNYKGFWESRGYANDGDLDEGFFN